MDFEYVDHPCLRRTKVPIVVNPPMTVSKFVDPKTLISEYAMGLISYGWSLSERED